MFLAINMGGSGTGPSFSVAYGANIVRRSAIPGLYGVMVFFGALIAGEETSNTLGKGLINPELMTMTLTSIILFSVSISLLIANIFGIPQSTSQSTVLAIIAPGLYFSGSGFNNKKLLLEIIPTWFILPIIAFFLAFIIGKYIYKPLRKRGYTMSKKLNKSPILNGLILLGSLYVAFSIGANNVANAVGPITSMTLNQFGVVKNDHSYQVIMLLSILMIAPLFGIGSSIFGYRVVQKTGKGIVQFGKIEAVIIAFISASLLLFASIWKGIPTSLVQLNVAAIIGIGVAKLGFKNIFKKTQVNAFFSMWIFAPAIAFSLSFLLVFIFDYYGWL